MNCKHGVCITQSRLSVVSYTFLRLRTIFTHAYCVLCLPRSLLPPRVTLRAEAFDTVNDTIVIVLCGSIFFRDILSIA